MTGQGKRLRWIMICPFEKKMDTPGDVGRMRNIFMTTAKISDEGKLLVMCIPQEQPTFPKKRQSVYSMKVDPAACH